MRRLLVAAALVACGKQDAAPTQKTDPPDQPAEPAPAAQQAQTLERLHVELPAGWTSRYDAEWDKWLIATPPLADGRTANARIERAPASAVASPEAFLHHRLTYWDAGAKTEIEKREGVKDGFAITVVVKAALDPDHAKRETYVVRQLGNVWYQCMSEWVPDDAFRDQLVALCKTLKL